MLYEVITSNYFWSNLMIDEKYLPLCDMFLCPAEPKRKGFTNNSAAVYSYGINADIVITSYSIHYTKLYEEVTHFLL